MMAFKSNHRSQQQIPRSAFIPCSNYISIVIDTVTFLLVESRDMTGPQYIVHANSTCLCKIWNKIERTYACRITRTLHTIHWMENCIWMLSGKMDIGYDMNVARRSHIRILADIYICIALYNARSWANWMAEKTERQIKIYYFLIQSA